MKMNRFFLVLAVLIALTLGCSQASLVLPTRLPETPVLTQALKIEDTAIPVPPVPTETALPTEDLPAAPANPTPTVIPGWNVFQGAGISISLPNSYHGGDLKANVGSMVTELRSMGENTEKTAQFLEQNPDQYAFWGYDTRQGASGLLTTVSANQLETLPGVPISTLADMVLQQFPGGSNLIDRQPAGLVLFEGERLVLETSSAGAKVKELIYVITDGHTAWKVVFLTAIEEFEQRLPIFELSIRTFYLFD